MPSLSAAAFTLSPPGRCSFDCAAAADSTPAALPEAIPLPVDSGFPPELEQPASSTAAATPSVRVIVRRVVVGGSEAFGPVCVHVVDLSGSGNHAGMATQRGRG